ncbi:MAG: CehA/McbA family metallohydrolase [Thermoleophilaceae bacterium]
MAIASFALLAALAIPERDGFLAPPLPEVALAQAGEACDGGDAMPPPDQVIEGKFSTDEEGSYVLLPFDVPENAGGKPITGLRVKYCYDQPEVPARTSHTLDLGLYEPRTDSSQPWGPDEFRGWGGSSHPDVTLSADGFEGEVADGATTRAFLPGDTPPGEWAAELGVASVASRLEGDATGEVAWRVEIAYLTDPNFEDEPYETTRCDQGGRCDYDSRPANAEPGWYAGDLHVHGEHSALDDAPLEEVFSYAFCPDPALEEKCDQAGAKPGAGLDFITLSDYVGGAQWGEIGRFQDDYPGKLIVRSAEVITYEGHTNAHGITDQVDYRTGPLLVRSEGGSLTRVRGPRPPSEIFDFVHSAPGSGFTQINHPTIFPSQVPGFDSLCRGCPWDYSDAETDYSKVDAIEIATGPAGLKQEPEPGPNPFTLTAIRFWEDAIDSGGLNSNKIAAVGVSDSHNAGRTEDPVTQAPIGQATTVVYADELSEQGIQEGVTAGHTYVKVFGNDGPDLRLEAVRPGSVAEPAIIGDTIEARNVDFTARVRNLDEARAARPGSYSLLVFRNGEPLLTFPLAPAGDSQRFAFPSVGPGRYRPQVQRESAIEAVSSPIYHERPGGGGPGPDPDPDPGPDPEPGGPCDNRIRGTNGADEITGTSRGDDIRAKRGADEVRALAGRDCVRGGRGADEVRGGRGRDLLRGSRGRDDVRAGAGNDRIRSRDGKRDLVGCGRGRDRVAADRRDRVRRSCERVARPRG